MISSFEVLIEKLKARLSDNEMLNFFSTMMKNDDHFRECQTKLYDFAQDAMKPDYELVKKVTPSIPELPRITHDQKFPSIKEEFKDSQWIVLTTPFSGQNPGLPIENLFEQPP